MQTLNNLELTLISKLFGSYIKYLYPLFGFIDWGRIYSIRYLEIHRFNVTNNLNFKEISRYLWFIKWWHDYINNK